MKSLKPLIDDLPGMARAYPIKRAYGRVHSIAGGVVEVDGLQSGARLGDGLVIEGVGEKGLRLEIIGFKKGSSIACAYDSLSGVRPGARAYIEKTQSYEAPSDAWLGKIIDPFGRDCSGNKTTGSSIMSLEASPLPANERGPIGDRLATGQCALDTFLPICAGQRVGIFASAGVGKSTLLGDLACMVEADVSVIALIGERGREVRNFTDHVLGPAGMARSVVIASTSDQSPMMRRRGGNLALTTAEYFRDQGKRVLLLFDSLTRYADAHRQIALAAGEAPSLHAYPPSTFNALASLVERAGPGRASSGYITAVFSVLVAGADFDEPVSDMARGILDGHIILDRAIAERGRFPAIDILRSTSRSLPGAASAHENDVLRRARKIFGAYHDAEAIIRVGLYKTGSDPNVDEAITIWPALDNFIGSQEPAGLAASFARLEDILKGVPAGASVSAVGVEGVRKNEADSGGAAAAG